MDRVLLITKDALCKEYLPLYGNIFWKDKTPNLDELSAKGTVFKRHITAAPSTVMAFRAMVMGKFAHEQPYSNYTPKEVPGESTDLFEYAYSLGYKGHIVWDQAWDNMVLKYGNCYGKNTIIHSIPDIRQGVGCHYNRVEPLKNNSELSEHTLKRIIDEVNSIIVSDNKVFVWLHLPHVINGRTAYGSDIDLFDQLIGRLREFFDDECIYISADHGNMNGLNGKYCYGFDVNTPSVEIPLITPRIEDACIIDFPTSNVDIKDIIFSKHVNKREYVYSDCAYFAQPHRKIAIYHGDFVYVYNKYNRREELYDVVNDPDERHNLINRMHYDVDRKITSPVREYYFSLHWDSIDEILASFRNQRKIIWKNAPWHVEFRERNIRRFKIFIVKILTKLRKK